MTPDERLEQVKAHARAIGAHAAHAARWEHRGFALGLPLLVFVVASCGATIPPIQDALWTASVIMACLCQSARAVCSMFASVERRRADRARDMLQKLIAEAPQ